MSAWRDLSFQDLRRLYVDEELSTAAIGGQFGVTKATVRRRLEKLGIERRSISEAAKVGFSSGRRVPLSGEKATNWQGGTRENSGYRMVIDPHGRTKSGYMMEHRLIMEQHLGRLLDPKEHVHHINQDRSDNRIENLEVLSQSEHMSLHVTERWRDGRMAEAVRNRRPRRR